MTLNLPDHTPAPETLAFAHELAALAATQTAQTRRELLAEVTRLESENTTLRQQVDALTGERDELLIGRRVKTTIPMGNVIWWELATQDGKEFTPTPPGLEGVIARSYGHYDKRLIVEFDDGEWADYEPEKFAFI